MFLLKLYIKNKIIKTNVDEKRKPYFIYIKTRIKKHILSMNKPWPIKKNFFVFFFLFLQQHGFLFSKKEKTISAFYIKKRNKQAVFYLDPFRLKTVFETALCLFFIKLTNTCFYINLYNILNIKNG